MDVDAASRRRLSSVVPGTVSPPAGLRNAGDWLMLLEPGPPQPPWTLLYVTVMSCAPPIWFGEFSQRMPLSMVEEWGPPVWAYTAPPLPKGAVFCPRVQLTRWNVPASSANRFGTHSAPPLPTLSTSPTELPLKRQLRNCASLLRTRNAPAVFRARLPRNEQSTETTLEPLMLDAIDTAPPLRA